MLALVLASALACINALCVNGVYIEKRRHIISPVCLEIPSIMQIFLCYL